MKTLEDLVNKLNEIFNYGKFVIRRVDDMDNLYVSRAYPKGDDIFYKDLFEYDYKIKGWLLCPELAEFNGAVQKIVVDFLSEFRKEGYEYLYQKKKYNIVIGEGECVGTVAAYCAMDDDVYVVDNRTEPEQLKDGAYQFTEEEIDNFKIKLSNKFAEIVDLGKVEVKDE